MFHITLPQRDPVEQIAHDHVSDIVHSENGYKVRVQRAKQVLHKNASSLR
jgi:hypothetical protein